MLVNKDYLKDADEALNGYYPTKAENLRLKPLCTGSKM